MNIFWPFSRWWSIFREIVGSGGYILSAIALAPISWLVMGGGGWWWVVVYIFWMVAGGGGWWWVAVGRGGSWHSLV